MNPDLAKLVRLHHADTELRRVEGELQELPGKKRTIDERLGADRARLDAARGALEGSQKARKTNESAVQDLEAKRSKYKGQLMDVKTNKEYTAMLHEIEGVEREIRGREDQVLAEMERAEGLGGEVKREETAFRSAEETHRSQGRALDERARTLEQETARARDGRDAVAATLEPDALALFQRVARLRGVAVSEARDGMCQACHLKLRPQMYVDLKRNDAILQCPACSRILYYEAPVETASPPS